MTSYSTSIRMIIFYHDEEEAEECKASYQIKLRILYSKCCTTEDGYIYRLDTGIAEYDNTKDKEFVTFKVSLKAPPGTSIVGMIAKI